MNGSIQRFRRPGPAPGLLVAVALGAALLAPAPAAGQEGGAPPGEWRYIGGDAAHTRYSDVDQITGENFEDLELAWLWRGDNFGPGVLGVSRADSRSTWTGSCTRWPESAARWWPSSRPPARRCGSYREPRTTRFDRGMRNGYGKGVAYAEIDGRGVIYIISPAFFLYALDARTGRPLENWGAAVPLPGLSAETGVVDLVPDLITRLGPLAELGRTRTTPDFGIPRELGHITSSSPPIVVNGVVVVGNSAEQGYYQTRIENVPGDIMGYDARTGEFTCGSSTSFPVPASSGTKRGRTTPGSGPATSPPGPRSRPIPERGLVYVPTNPPTIDFYGGLPAGRRAVRHQRHRARRRDRRAGVALPDRAPRHLELRQPDRAGDARTSPWTAGPREIVVQTTKQGWAFTFDRVTGEPIWPIEERPVPQSEVPGERLVAHPADADPPGGVRDAGADRGRPDRLHARAARRGAGDRPVTTASGRSSTRPSSAGTRRGCARSCCCPSGASNIFGPTAGGPRDRHPVRLDAARLPLREHRGRGSLIDEPNDIKTTGRTFADFAVLNRGDFRGPQWPADVQAALQPHRRHRHEHGRAPVGNAQRRHARQHPRSPGAEWR